MQLSNLIENLQAQLDELKAVSEANPELTTNDLIQPIRDEVAKAVREQIWGIFDESGRAIGRNSPEAVKADARVAIKQGFESGKLPPFIAKKGRGNASSPEVYIQTVVADILNKDQINFMYDIDLYGCLRVSESGTKHPLHQALYRRLKK